MSESHDIDSLLKASPSVAVALKLVEWANETRDKIIRGDMIIGILTPDEATKIPSAYRRAAEIGRPDAWIRLAWWHASPQFGEQDLESAEAALQNAIEADAENAQLELVKLRFFFQRDTATTAEKKQVFQAISAIVESQPTSAEAIYFLALLTTHGFGVVASPKAGFALQLKAADRGNADAMFELYIHHAQGLGTPTDEVAAFQACERAAEAGHSRAMYNMGAFYAAGRGTPKNIPAAIKWYERSADAGNPSAMAGLAVIYATGDGVEADRKYAEQLFDQADYCGLDVSHLREKVGM